MKTVITVSRKWNRPEITTCINKEGISLSMDINDFKKALKQEIGSVRYVFKQETFEAMIDAAFENIIEGIKEESIKVIA